MAQTQMSCSDFLRAISRKKSYDNKDVMETPLNRCLSTAEVIFIGIGVTAVGALDLPGLSVMEAGPAALLSTAIAGLTVILISFSYIELCCRLPRAGSSYSYVYVTLGELPAFIVGWSVILLYLLSIGGSSKALSANINLFTNYTISNYFAEAIPGWPTDSDWLSPYPDFIAAGFVISAVCVVLAGAEVSVWAIAAIGLTTVAVAVVISVTMLANANVVNLAPPIPFAPNGLQGVLSGAATSFVLFTGFDAMTIAGEETKNPARSVPIAVFFSLSFATAVLLLTTLALLLFVPFTEITNAPIAFSMSLDQRGIVWAGYVAAGCNMLGNYSVLLVAVYAMPRVIYAVARDELLYSWLGAVWKSTQVPINATLVANAIAVILSILLSYAWFANTTSIAALIAYTMVGVSAVVLRYSEPKRFLNQTAVAVAIAQFDSQPAHDADKPTPSASEKTPLVDADADDTNDADDDAEQAGELSSWADCLPLPAEMRDAERGVVALSMLGVYVVSAAVLAIGFIYMIRWIVDGAWWADLIVTLFGVIMAISVGIISLYRRNDSTIKTFKVPAVPWIPAISILLNFLIMFACASNTWLGYLVWLLIGLVIYFSFGMWHGRTLESRNSSFID